jgi:hypothetical protein
MADGTRLNSTLHRRHAAIVATLFVHALLILGWQAARRAPSIAPDPRRMSIRWIPLAAPRREETHATSARPHALPHANPVTVVHPAAPAAPAPVASAAGGADTAAPPARSDGAALLERARREAGAIDRALRKENNPYIVAPPDSPQIRLRKGIQAAADLAPNAWYEAPKVVELVNDTGDGARRTRVITPGGAYCVTERAPTTSIDMIEKHGKIRVTDCGTGHEQPANAQEWRTARD